MATPILPGLVKQSAGIVSRQVAVSSLCVPKSQKATAAQNTSSGDVPQMPPCDFKPQPYKGPLYEKARKIRADNINPALLTYYKKPVMINQGHMQWLWDHEGKRYLDLFAGIVTVSVGHCHPKTVQALHEQTNKLWHTTNIYLHPKIHEYVEKLVSKLPEHLKVCYLVNSGSDANDLAMLMARMHTQRFDILSFRNAYHGASPYLMGVTALSTWRYNVPSGFGVQQVMNPDVYRGPWGGKHCRDSIIQTNRSCDCAAGCCMAEQMYMDQFEDVFRYCMPKAGVAGFFAESIQGVGGAVQYPKGFLKKAFDLVKAKGGVCISDEVQTGFGRTGTHYWGFEAHDVKPDIVTMAKGIANGFPMAAVVTTKEIASTLGSALHFNTYGGNPMACAVGSAVIDVIEEDGCQKISHEVGSHFLTELAKLRDEFEVVGDVRGKGLMIGVELVENKETRAPLSAERFSSIWESCKDDGVLVGKGGLYGTVLRIKPPMCITRQDVDFSIAVLRKALNIHGRA